MKLAYRPDIDGLRAIAVILVLLHHIGLSWFSGGFIGVDVFFVISGFLISSIVMQDIQAGHFSIALFYQKRVLRLAPAYFTVLLTVSIVACWVLLPQELSQYFYSVIYACVFAANIFMYQEVGDYFSGDVSETPLLHLWSLGVEEQFYLFWPLLLWLLWRMRVSWTVLGNSTARSRPQKNPQNAAHNTTQNTSYNILPSTAHNYRICAMLLTFGLLMASLIYSYFAIQTNIGKAYYWMPVRAFELFCGALIYFLPQRDWSFKLRWLLSIAAAIVIGCCALMYSKTTVFPGIAALPVCIATAAIIYIGQQKQDFQQKHDVQQKHAVQQKQYHAPWLCAPIMRWLGKLSYPLYLWHWPVVVLCQLMLWPFNALNQLGMVIASITLAYLTYRFIEQPSQRLGRLHPWQIILGLYALPAVLFCSVAWWVMHADGLPQRFKPQVLQQVNALQSFAHEIRQDCHNTPRPSQLPKPEDCVLGVGKTQIDFLLIGDSHANHFSGVLDEWATHAGLRGYDITQDTTLFLPHVAQVRQMNGQWQRTPKFQQRNDALSQHLTSHRYKIVVLSGYWSVYLKPEMQLTDVRSHNNLNVFKNGMRHAVQQIIASGAIPIILLDSLVLDGQKAICPVRAYSLGLKRDCSVPIVQLRQQQVLYLPMLQQLQREFPQLILLDPNRVLCDATRCKLVLNGVPLYRDKDFSHLNDTGARALGLEYLKRYGNPLQQALDVR